MTEPTINQLFDLSGRVALVTGGAGYLGSSMCGALAEAGASVVISSRDLERAKSAASELPIVGEARHFGVVLDHTDEDSLKSGFNAAIDQAGQIDILVNNGQGGPAKDWTAVTGEEFEQQLRNASGYFLLSRCLRDHVTARSAAGSIVMIGSMYGVVGSYPEAYADVCSASPVAYHALKGGIIQMTRHLAVYWASDNIRVNCLSPGPFPNDNAPVEMVTRLKDKSPMRRMGEPHELKGALLLLTSDAGSYLTGQNLVVDGGWTAW
ncbi:MAG: SDR family oxidoreductase [Planctomycetaceae bacterium]|jgi:NAD(P)-dependent dehydrogenase (short-subunit alcohol dehydrogenase family)|nr:SDR family oxidoreductase [Planctomycetaceae bacterium]